MLYSEYDEIRKNFGSIFNNIHCKLTHDNTFVIHECNKLILKLNDNISFQHEYDEEEFKMGGYRERDEMVARLEKLRDIARKDRDKDIDPDVILPDIDTSINSINYEKVNISDDVLQDIDNTINSINYDGVNIDGTDALKDIDTNVNSINYDGVKINDELNTIDSLGVDLFNSNNNSIEIYTETDLDRKVYLPLRFNSNNESPNVFFGINGYKKCNIDKNKLCSFNESCDTLATVTYNSHDGSVDVCHTLLNILESAKNNKNTAEAIDTVLITKVNIISSLKYLCSIDDSYNEYYKFYRDCARMCDDLISSIKSAEESNKNNNDVFDELSSKGVLLPIIKFAGNEKLSACIGPSKSILVNDSYGVIDNTKFNIDASLAGIRKYNDEYNLCDSIHLKIDNICSDISSESCISKLGDLTDSIIKSYDTVKQYSSDIDTYKYVYDYYVNYIDDLMINIRNSKRDEDVKTALSNIGSVKADDIIVQDSKDFSLSRITDFSKSWYDGTADMDFFLRYFKFEDKMMIGPDGTLYTLVSDLLLDDEHYDGPEVISQHTFSKGTAIAPDGTMLKYIHGEMYILTQSEWISELGCEDIDNSESNLNSHLYKAITDVQKKMISIGNWKGCFPLNNSKEELSKVPLLARCFLVEEGSNKRPVFFHKFKPCLDDSDRGLQDTSYYLKASSEQGDSYKFLYANRIILNGKGSAVREQDEAIDRENRKSVMRQITNEKLNSLTKGKVQSVDGVIDLTGSVLKGIGSVSGKAGSTISKFFKQSKKK